MSANRESDASARPPARSIDGAFEHLYRRFGPRYVDVFKLFVWAGICLFVVPADVALLTAPWDPSLGEFVRCVLAYELVLGLIAGPGTFVIARWAAPATFSWIGGRKAPGDAPAAWKSTASGLARWVGITTLWWGAWCVPPSLYTAATLHFEWYGYAIYLLGLTSLNSVVSMFFYLLFEQALRPVVREIAAQLPKGYEPRSVMTLSVKALVLIPAINFFSAVVVGLTVKDQLAPELYLGHVVLLALVVSLTLSLVLTLMFRNSVLRRIEDLRDAMCRVDRGDLDTHVVRLAGDELDDMGTSFNEMVAGLRDREALRDHNAQLVVDLQRQARELQSSRARIVAASDAARRQVERDLHDGAQQGLLLLRLKLEMAALENGGVSPAAAATFAALRSELDRALADLRDLAHGIYPTILEIDGVSAALREAARRARVPTRVDCAAAGAERYPTELEAAVYFCCVEALQNTAKHAGEDARAQITLAERDNVLHLEVSDDGRGFAACAASPTAGLQNMTDRIGALGGILTIQSTPGSGTTIVATVPLTTSSDTGEAADFHMHPARL
jgi:signal transduction histidine kinase